MSILKELEWGSNNKVYSSMHWYAVIIDKDAKDKFAVIYKRIGSEDNMRKATGFATIADAKAWCWNHYNEKMQPYVNELSLKDAVTLLVDSCHSQAVKGGWWHDIATGEPLQRNVGELLMLIVSEVSEAMEGDRKDLQDDHLPQYKMMDVEIADVLIRVGDLIGGLKLDTANALVDKLEYNANRADHKIENRVKDGGKKY